MSDLSDYKRMVSDPLEQSLRRTIALRTEQRDRARALACRLEEELALIRRAAATRRYP